MNPEKSYKPKLIAFEVTTKCQYNCLHCRADADQYRHDNELTTEQCKKILASVADFTKCVIILTGGEPLERTDIYELISYGKSIGHRMVMATCGYLIDQSSIEKLKASGISALSFSLDGASEETNDWFRQTPGAFKNVIIAAKLAAAAKIKFQINSTITKTNLAETLAIADLAEKLGAYCFNPFILVPTGRGREIADSVIDPIEYEALIHELLNLKLNSNIEIRLTCGPQFARICNQKKVEKISKSTHGCMGGDGFGFISSTGEIQICGFLDISAGNIIQNNYDFKKIWLESPFLKKIRDKKNYTGKCGSCQYLPTCGGCRARAYTVNNDYLSEDPVCNYTPGEKS